MSLQKGIFNRFQTLYYSHSTKIYGTALEAHQYYLIRRLFKQRTIINPSDYEMRWKVMELSGARIMEECLEMVSKCDALVFSSLLENGNYHIGKGCFDEIVHAEKLSIPILYLHANDTFYNQDAFSVQLYNEKDWKSTYKKFNNNPHEIENRA
eukprot:370753_1